jgi:hypothetical protein
MKTVQIAVALLVMVGLVFGVVFFKNYLSGTTPSPSANAPTAPTQGVNAPLIFPVPYPDKDKPDAVGTIVDWKPRSAGEFELHTTGHYDFWFDNPHDWPVNIRVDSVNCTCARVEACTFPTEEGQRFRRWQVASGVFPALQAHCGLPGVLGQLFRDVAAPHPDLVVNLKWKVLLTADKKDTAASLVAPPKGAGIIRVYWAAKEEGLKRVTAQLVTHPEGVTPAAEDKPRLEIPTKLTPAMRFDPPLSMAVGDLAGRDTRDAVVLCWSPYYAAFNLKARVLNRDRQEDPCITCAVRPLTDAERDELAQRQESRVLSGYRVDVKVHERISERQMLELGPLMRRVQLVTDLLPDPAGPLLTGVVRGEVQIGTPEDNERIDLKSFPAEQGKRKEVAVVTEPGCDLESGAIECDPDFLKVALVQRQAAAKDGSGAVWTLQVDVPPGRAFGPLPSHSAIYLQLKGNPPRRIRIPVLGNAYVK